MLRNIRFLQNTFRRFRTGEKGPTYRGDISVRVLWFPLYLIKNLFFAIWIGAIIGLLIPPVGIPLFLMLLLASMGASWEDAGAMAQWHEVQGESDGFDAALRLTKQNFSQGP